MVRERGGDQGPLHQGLPGIGVVQLASGVRIGEKVLVDRVVSGEAQKLMPVRGRARVGVLGGWRVAACLVSAAAVVAGCGGQDEPTPPPGLPAVSAPDDLGLTDARPDPDGATTPGAEPDPDGATTPGAEPDPDGATTPGAEPDPDGATTPGAEPDPRRRDDARRGA